MRLIKCAMYYALTGFFCFFLGRLLPKKYIRSSQFPFKSFSFEKEGKFYERLNIKSWQKKIPDMSKLFPSVINEKKIGGYLSLEEIDDMIKETCVAELSHIFLFVTGLGCFRFFKPRAAITVYIIYFFANLPYIVVQRYNRPRLERLYALCESRINPNQTENEVSCRHTESH